MDLPSSDAESSASQLPGEYILHPEGSEQSHCSYAIFLLNKVFFNTIIFSSLPELE